MSRDHFILGDWNAICDRCGRKKKASAMRKTWQGWYVCGPCWEPRHPQDFAKGIAERPVPPWVRPPTEGYGETPFIYPPPNIYPPQLPPNVTHPGTTLRVPNSALEPPYGQPPVIYGGDPLFGSVLLLLAGPAGSGVTDDASSYNRAMSVVGTLTLSGTAPLNGVNTYEKPYGNADINFSNRLELTAGDSWVSSLLGAGEWCLETYFRPSAVGTGSDILFSFGQIQLTWLADESVGAQATNIGFSSYSVGSSAGVLAIGDFKHLCLIRDNTTNPTFGFLRLFVDGTLVGSSLAFIKTDTMNGTGFGYALGYTDSSPGGYFGGLRLTRNTRRYLTNAEGEAVNSFTPDTYPFKTS